MAPLRANESINNLKHQKMNNQLKNKTAKYLSKDT